MENFPVGKELKKIVWVQICYKQYLNSILYIFHIDFRQ